MRHIPRLRLLSCLLLCLLFVPQHVLAATGSTPTSETSADGQAAKAPQNLIMDGLNEGTTDETAETTAEQTTEAVPDQTTEVPAEETSAESTSESPAKEPAKQETEGFQEGFIGNVIVNLGDDPWGFPIGEVQKVNEARKFVMIGDSYAYYSEVRGVTYPWPEGVRDALGIAPDRCRVYRSSGYGYARSGQRFVKLLRRARVDRSVTDVLIVGGVGNDFECSHLQISMCYGELIRRLRQLYPHATIMQGSIEWSEGRSTWQTIYKERLKWYRALAERHDVVYLDGCESVLSGHAEYLADDLRHPNEAGSDAITRALVRAIRAHRMEY